MKAVNSLLAILFSVAFNFCFSQTFQRTFGNTGIVTGTSIKSTLDGNYIISGFTAGFSNGYDDAYLLKMDSAGNMLWSKAYGGTYRDRVYYVNTCSDGGYIMTGYTSVYTTGNYIDLFMVRTASDGTLLWSKSVGGNNDEYGWQVTETNDGGFLSVGSSKSFTNSNFDGYAVKTDAAGALQWTKVIGGTSTDNFNGMSKTNDGGYIITGLTSTNSFGSSDIWLVKLDSNGDTLWTKQYGKATEDAGNAVIQTTDGGYMIAGDIHINPSAGDHNSCLLKTDSSGNLQWVKTYGSNPGSEIAWDLQQTSDGGYLLLGSSGFYGNGNGDILSIKTDNSGNLQWAKTYGNTAFDDFWYAQKTPDDGNMIVATTTEGNQKIYIIKTDSQGNSSCNTTTVTPNVNIPVMQTRSGTNVISGGTLTTSSTFTYSATATSTDPCALVAVSEVKNLADEVSVYPNPFSEKADIRISEIPSATITLSLFNVFGQEIYPDLFKNGNGFTIYRGNIPSGVYFYKLESLTEVIATGKIIIE